MTPCTCDKWREVKAAFDEKPLFKFEAMVKRQEWTCCPWCGCLLIPLIDPKTALSGSENPRGEAEWRVMGPGEKPKGLDEFRWHKEGTWEPIGCGGRFSASNIRALRQTPTMEFRTKRPLPTQPEE